MGIFGGSRPAAPARPRRAAEARAEARTQIAAAERQAARNIRKSEANATRHGEAVLADLRARLAYEAAHRWVAE